MQRGPAISVVMPVFNRQDRVAAAIRSVLQQDFDDFELVIVDDASTDGTVQVIERFTDARVRLLRQSENRHAAAARNRGVRDAAAPLIAFLDSDDAFLPHKLRFVVDYFAHHPAIDALLDSFVISYPPRSGKADVARINPTLEDSQQILAGVYARTISKATPALSARRDALLRAGLFDESLGRRQDFDLIVRLTRVCRCATTDQVLWRKQWTESTITARLDTRMDAILDMCARDPAYLTTSRYRVGVARDLARHVLRLIGKGRLGLLRRDMGRFAATYGAALTARLVLQGIIENARRGLARHH